MTPTVEIPARFHGPPGSGNGGWSAGALAAHLDAPLVEVRLRRPPPLDLALEVCAGVGAADGWTVAARGGEVVLQARPAAAEPVPLEPVPAERARAAEAEYAGRSSPFPGCFVCGTDRAEGDGLRLFTGPVGPGLVAATWTPHPSVCDAGRATLPVTWAAIDCAGAWAAGLEERPMVLGSITARVHALPRAGVEHVVVGAHRRTEGRKHLTATTLRDPDGTVLATSEQVWIGVDPDRFA